MLGTTRQHGLDSVRGSSQADQTNARLETAPSCPVTAGYKMEHCCCKASGGAGGMEGTAWDTQEWNREEFAGIPLCALQQTSKNRTSFPAEG